jgi:hypothetical protein
LFIMQAKTWILGIGLVLGLAACGQTDIERTASGAAIGAGVAAATDSDPLVGAAVGGAAGYGSKYVN